MSYIKKRTPFKIGRRSCNHNDVTQSVCKDETTEKNIRTLEKKGQATKKSGPNEEKTATSEHKPKSRREGTRAVDREDKPKGPQTVGALLTRAGKKNRNSDTRERITRKTKKEGVYIA